MKAFRKMWQKYVPSLFCRTAVLPIVLGFALGLGMPPAFDKAAEYHVYGEDTAYALPAQLCMMVGMSAGPEIYSAKQMGMSKRQYMAYVVKAADGAEDLRLVNQIIWYVSEMWSAKDDGSAALELCFERAEKEDAKPSDVRI